MARYIVLDSNPLSEAAGPRGRPMTEGCRTWIDGLETSGASVVVPGIVDYEVRRKFLHLGAIQGIRRLDDLRSTLDFREITTAILDRAAGLGADLRLAGAPTAAPGSLDADCILAAHALDVGGPGDVVTIATTNPGHLSRFRGIDAREWTSII